jgi:dihydroorotase
MNIKMIILLKNLSLITPEKITKDIDILIENGTISEIAQNIMKNAEKTIGCKGKTAFPAFFDMHVHLRDPGYTYKEDIVTGTKAAAAGGFWGVCSMPNTDPVVDSVPVVEYIINKANKEGHARVFPAAAITKGLGGRELTEMLELKSHGAVAVSDDGKPVSDSNVMRQALIYAAMAGLPVISHSEDLSLVNGGVMNEGETSNLLGLRGITRAAEETAVSREIIIAETYNVPIHITHISTKGSVEIIRAAKGRGAKVTCDTAPHYFSLTDNECVGYNTNAKMNPPLRTSEDAAAIIAGIKDGTIDAIATDHAPHHFDEKKVEFDNALNGIIGLETAFSVAVDCLYHKNGIDLRKIVELMAVNPPKILNITPAAVEAGAAANIVVADLEKEWKPAKESFLSKSKNSPYIGKTLKGKIETVITNGILR